MTMYHPGLTPPYGDNWQLAVFSQSASSGEVIRDEAEGINDSQEQSTTEIEDTFGLEFAAVQWLNLVTNAEKLFNNLLHSILLSGDEKEQIQRWLCLKQECEECVASEEATSHHRHSLERIEELTEDTEEISDENEKSADSQYESDTESDFDSHFPDFEEKLDGYMDIFKDKTDMLIRSKLEEDESLDDVNETLNKSTFSLASAQNYLPGRRNSLFPGSKELPVSLLKENRRKDLEDSDFSESYDENKKCLAVAQSCAPEKSLSEELKSLASEMDYLKNKIKESKSNRKASCERIINLKETIESTEKWIEEIQSNIGVNLLARQKIGEKHKRLDEKHYNIKVQITQAEFNLRKTHDKEKIIELNKTIKEYKKLENKYKEMLDNTAKVKRIAEESAKLIPRILEQLEDLNEEIKFLELEVKLEEERKRKLEGKCLECEKKIKSTKQRLQKSKGWGKKLAESSDLEKLVEEIEKSAGAKEPSKKLQHIVQQIVGKGKSKNKLKNSKEEKLDKSEEKDEKDHRNDIRDLRDLKNSVIDERSSSDEKYTKGKRIFLNDSRKRLEYDETIGAIDAVIEYKNELLSGRTSSDSLERHTKEKGEHNLALLDQLSRMPPDHIRSLLCHFLQKVTDLRDSARKMEQQIYELERKNEELKNKNKNKSFEIQRLERTLQFERDTTDQRLVAIKRNHQMEKNLLLKQIAEESGSSGTDSKKYLTFTKGLDLSEGREKKQRKGKSSVEQAVLQTACKTVRIRNKSSSPDPKSSKGLPALPSSSTSTSKIKRENNKIVLRFEKNEEKRKK